MASDYHRQLECYYTKKLTQLKTLLHYKHTVDPRYSGDPLDMSISVSECPQGGDLCFKVSLIQGCPGFRIEGFDGITNKGTLKANIHYTHTLDYYDSVELLYALVSRDIYSTLTVFSW